MEARSHPWSIVVGVDGSEEARHALAWSREEAALRGADLLAAHVWAQPAPVSELAVMATTEDNELYDKLAHELLRCALDDLGPRSGPAVEIESRVVHGYPSTALLEQAESSDLLVLGRRGRGGFRGLLLGSVSQQCIHHSTRPVAVIPRSAPLPDDRDVVVGVDGSDQSRVALRWAADEAIARGARLSVVFAWPTPHAVGPGAFGIGSLPVPDLTEESSRMLHVLVESALASADARPVDIELVAIEERPVRALLDRSANAGMLVVGSRGHGGFAELLLGSVSQQCLHHATCAVVVVPHPR